MTPVTVLLVDYDPVRIEAIRRALASLDVVTIVATDGQMAEREFFRARPHVTLVQEMIPKRRGIDLCRTLKRGRRSGERAIILLTRAGEGARDRMESAWCDDLIETPIDEAALVATVRKFLPDPAAVPVPSL